MQLKPGIHFIPDMGISNAYLVEDGDKIIVIDTGTPGHAKKIVTFVKSLGKEPSSVETIVLTHPDFDHSGSVFELKQLTGAKVAIHALDAPRLAGEKPLKEAKGASGYLMKAFSSLMRFKPVAADILLKEGAFVGPLEIIETPGHTAGSLSLFKEGIALFSGDALVTDKNGAFRKPSGMVTLDVQRAKESIRKMAMLEFDGLMPGHGAPVLDDASKKLKEFVTNELDQNEG